MCRHLKSDGADSRDDKNVGERDARQGPAQRSPYPLHVVMSRHKRIPFASLNLPGEGRKKGVIRLNPGGSSSCLIGVASGLRLPESGCGRVHGVQAHLS
jgi:hypothetical protein